MEPELKAKPETQDQSEEIAELERDLQQLAQLLLEIYLWRSEQNRQQRDTTEIDKQGPPGTMGGKVDQ